MDTQYDIDIMTQVTGMLHSLPYEDQTPDYQKIMMMVHTYLLKNCKHCIATDYIDTDVEKGQTVRYCEKCYLTFD